MSLISSAVKVVTLAATATVCPPAAAVLYLGNIAAKTAKGISDENEGNAPKHLAAMVGAIAGGAIDIDVDVDRE